MNVEKMVKEIEKEGYVKILEKMYLKVKNDKELKSHWQYLNTEQQGNDTYYVLMNEKGFNKRFWEQYIKAKENGDKTIDSNCKVVRVKGFHYVINDKGWEGYTKGFGGRIHKIEFIDGPYKGLTVETDNLWSQGEIPNEFLPKLPDNAIFK